MFGFGLIFSTVENPAALLVKVYSGYLEDMQRQVCFSIEFALHGATSASAVAVGTGVGALGSAHAN